MGSELRRWLADRLPADVSSGERLVALEAADNAWDSTRVASRADLLEILIRRTGYSDAKQIGKVLGKLAARGIELRAPMRTRDGQAVTDKLGRVVYAAKGHQLEIRIPTEEECPALKLPPAGDLQSSPERETFAVKAPPPGPKGPPPGTQSSPQRGTPISNTSEEKNSLPLPERLVRAAAVVAPEEERDFIGWINNKHNPRGPGWWKTVASNGDLPDLAAAWRATKTRASPGASSSLPPWCEECNDGDPVARHNPKFRLTRAGELCTCHPDHAAAA